MGVRPALRPQAQAPGPATVQSLGAVARKTRSCVESFDFAVNPSSPPGPARAASGPAQAPLPSSAGKDPRGPGSAENVARECRAMRPAPPRWRGFSRKQGSSSAPAAIRRSRTLYACAQPSAVRESLGSDYSRWRRLRQKVRVHRLAKADLAQEKILKTAKAGNSCGQEAD